MGIFQQFLSLNSPLLSPECFHLKTNPCFQTVIVKNSLGLPSYILHKKTFFLQDHLSCMLSCIFKCCVTKFFFAQVGLLCISKCLHHFSFRCPSGLGSIFKMLRHLSLCCPSGSFGCPQWDFFGTSGGQLVFCWGVLGPDWELSGTPPLWVLSGVPLFWDDLKIDPVKSIWVSFNFNCFGFHSNFSNSSVDKIQKSFERA